VVIDIHTHSFCPPVELLLRDQLSPLMIPYKRDMSAESAETDMEQGRLLQEPFNSVERRFNDMRRMGVDKQVIAPAPGQQHYWAGPLVPQISRMQNDHIARLVAEAPHAFAGLGTLPMPDVEASIAEASRAVEELGLRGFQIDTRVNELELSDRSLAPLWTRLAQLGVPLFVHPLGFSHGQRLGPFFMVNTVGQPLEESIAFQHFVFGGVLDRHPDLKVLICHGGGYMPFYIGRLDHAWSHRPELKQLLADPPSSYIRRFYFDTCVYRPDLIEYLVHLAGADRILLGSDYPFDMGDSDPVSSLNACATLSAEQRTMIAAGNAKTLFRIT
jgi:aminocarboxymuconate-semialdehyde decarboxylase